MWNLRPASPDDLEAIVALRNAAAYGRSLAQARSGGAEQHCLTEEISE